MDDQIELPDDDLHLQAKPRYNIWMDLNGQFRSLEFRGRKKFQ